MLPFLTNLLGSYFSRAQASTSHSKLKAFIYRLLKWQRLKRKWYSPSFILVSGCREMRIHQSETRQVSPLLFSHTMPKAFPWLESGIWPALYTTLRNQP